MSARKRSNRPGRRAPSRRPAVRASEPTPAELTGEADAAPVPAEEAETQQRPQPTQQEATAPGEQGTEPAEPAEEDATASSEAATPETATPETAEVEASAAAAQETEAGAAAATAEPAAEEPVGREAEEPGTSASTAPVEPEPGPAAAGPEVLEPEAAQTPERQPEPTETAERETGAAGPEAPEPEAAEPEAAEPEAPEPEAAEPRPRARADREAEPGPDLREGPEAEPEAGFGEPAPAEPLAVEPLAQAEPSAPPSVPPAEPSDGAVAEEPAARNGWAVLYHMGKPRLTKANLFAAVLAVGLGFAVVAQVQQTQNAGLESLREDELVRILDDFTQENLRLGNEIRDLESSRDRLISGAGTSSEALRAAQERADALGILAGTRPARGEGIEMTIADPSGQIMAPLLLDTLEELRDAGAEAVQIGGIRVVASSYFTDVDGGIELSGQRLERPYTILAIGDRATLASAMKIPGGVVDTVRGKDGITTITEKPQIDITALHVVRTPQYAQPVPSPTSS